MYLKKYDDFTDIKSVDWTKYVIVVPEETDRKELMEAFEHLHYSNVNKDFVTVNQLVHEYLDDSRIDGCINNIIVDKKLYEKIKVKR